MSKAVLSFRDIVKGVAKCLVKVKTDPLLLPFSHGALEQQQLLVTTACSLCCQSTAGTYSLPPTTTTKAFYGTAETLKSFQRGSTRHQTKHFAVVWLFILAFTPGRGEVGSPVTHKPFTWSNTASSEALLSNSTSGEKKMPNQTAHLWRLTSCKRWLFNDECERSVCDDNDDKVLLTQGGTLLRGDTNTEQQSNTLQVEKGNWFLLGNLHPDLQPAACAAVELEREPEVLWGNRSHELRRHNLISRLPACSVASDSRNSHVTCMCLLHLKEKFT